MKKLKFDEAPYCAVGLSKIQGEGLFALKEFSVDEVVANYSESFDDWPTILYKDLPEAIRQRCWFTGVDKEWVKVADEESVFMRANHSKNPNTLWLPEKHMLIAVKIIAVGDEITYDYTREIIPDNLVSKRPEWAL